MASNITVSGLVVAPGIQQTYAQWEVDDPNVDGLPYLQLDRVELWAATTNDRDLATKVAEGVTFASYVYSGLDKRWHWIRARDREGQYGDWYPSSSTDGEVAGGVWQSYTPTIGPTTGDWSTYSVLRSVYFKVGQNVTFNILASISNNGDGDGRVDFSLPIVPASNTSVSGVVGTQSERRALAAIVFGSSVGACWLYDGTYPIWTAPCELSIAGTYEAFAG